MEGGDRLHGEKEIYRPCVQQNGEIDHRQHSANSADSAQLMSVDQCRTIQEIDDSQLVGAPVLAVSVDADMKGKDDVKSMVVDVQVVNEAKVVEMSAVKRKRGRPPRIQGKTATPPQQRKTTDEEDVCFICFDGGSLVLCDRRGCPKAYHPACVKRDEAFFRSKAKWNCGWHICSTCRKASYYMCYTCTYSLCKGCTRDADYVCIRENKGLCGICMRTIMLIENVAEGNNEMVQVDFDDKTSWEYLFKVYWIYLKQKLSLTLDELTKARNPWKGDGPPKSKNYWRGTGTMPPRVEPSGELYHWNDKTGPCSDNCYGNLETNHSKRRKTNNQESYLNENIHVGMDKSNIGKVTTLPEGTLWATKELLEFVAHMRNGNVSMLSQFEVQSLLLEYIERNNLHDPQQKCQIFCDSRLINLFGKTRVGHLEMLKLLEDHFLIKERSPTDDTVRAGVTDPVGIEIEPAVNDNKQMMGNDRRCKSRKTTDERGLVNHNPDEYAAIDVHNINLLFLKRSCMESLMDDSEKFHEKVVGSFVRIPISGGDQKQDMYRLVQVVGTSKVAESYKVGKRTTDVMLEILNLDKKEVVSIDVISDQEFSEDECRCLHQSMKCGLIKQLKVGEIQEKAMMLQAVKVGDWLEAEILRLIHLRDQASEKGHRNELREYVEKLELLNSPEERQRRLLEIPNVHADAMMNPTYLSEEYAGESDEKKRGDHMRTRNSGIDRSGAYLNCLSREGNALNNIGNMAQKNLASVSDQTTNVNMTFYVDRDGTTRALERVSESTWSQGRDAVGFKNQSLVGPTDSATIDLNSQSMVRSELVSGVSLQALSPPLSIGTELSVNDVETEKLWHCQDPAGKVRGPCTMMQLHKWSTDGLLPRDLRVWRINEKQNDSILLIDALVGRLHKEPAVPHNSYLPPQEVRVSSCDPDKKWEQELSLTKDATWVDNKNVDESCKLVQNHASINCKQDNEQVGSDKWSSRSSSWNAFVDIAIASGGNGQTDSCLQAQDLSKDSKPWADQHQTCSSVLLPSSGKLSETPLAEVREGAGYEKCSSSPGNINENSHKTVDGQTNIGAIDVRQADSEGNSSQSSGKHLRPPPINSSSSVMGSNSDSVTMAKSVETSKQNQEIDFSDLLSSTPKKSHDSSKGQAAENKQSISSDVPVLDSGPSWSTASSVVVGGAHGYSPAATKPSIKEWGSNPLSALSMKLPEGASDHTATPTSGNEQLAHSSPAQPVIDASSWQAIIPEPNEFCSLVDESVSDLLAEVEAMESLAGLPSPTSKMRELTQDSDNDCFSPVEGFSPALDLGKSDAFSSTNDIQMPSQLTVADGQLTVSHAPSQPIVAGKPLKVSQITSQLTVTDEPLQADVPDSRKSFGKQSSTKAKRERDGKLSDASDNKWEAGSEIQLAASSTVNKMESGSVRRPAPSIDTIQGTAKGNVNLNQGVAANPVTVQQHTSTYSTATNPVSWVGQQRYGTDKFSSPRDHRNYYQGRDSGFSRDRFSWNRQPLNGVGNGGSFRPQPKGQRICKFYESGYCKKGASCNYWHPQ